MSRTTIKITANPGLFAQQQILQNASKIYQNAIASAKPKLMKDADLIVKSAIDAYYDSYAPHEYGRQESLYSVFKIEETGGNFDLVFDAPNGSHRVSNDYIYDVMFKKGYHGGAPHNGSYYWRFPSAQFANELGVPPYIAWYPFGPAVQTESPWERIQAEWTLYSNTEGKQLLLSAFRNEMGKVIKEVL